MSDPLTHQQLLASTSSTSSTLSDSDPQESAEWREAFTSVLHTAGPRACVS